MNDISPYSAAAFSSAPHLLPMRNTGNTLNMDGVEVMQKMECGRSERLADMLLEFIEREIKEPSSDESIRILPAMAQVLSEMIKNSLC